MVLQIIRGLKRREKGATSTAEEQLDWIAATAEDGVQQVTRDAKEKQINEEDEEQGHGGGDGYNSDKEWWFWNGINKTLVRRREITRCEKSEWSPDIMKGYNEATKELKKILLMSDYMHQIQGVVSNVKSKSIVKLYPNNKRDVQITHEVSKVVRRLAHVLMMNICQQMWMRINGLEQKDEDMKGKGKRKRKGKKKGKGKRKAMKDDIEEDSEDEEEENDEDEDEENGGQKSEEGTATKCWSPK
ncbi:hypothetical protein AcV5_009922 [Taiwanofungus camphoratus]|nr:hypothetical protein AcV5_009922 [Antrodia cinnamomea]